MKMTEKQIESQCNILCKKHKVLPLKLVLFVGMGFPDRTLLKDGKAVFVEYKTDRGNQSKMQAVWQDRLELLGFNYYICRSLDDMKRILKNEFNV